MLVCNFLWLPIASSQYSNLKELATEPFLLLHREHGTGYQRSWNCCDRRARFVVIWKHFWFILSTCTGIRINSVMHPRSSIRGAIQVPQLQLQLQCNFLHFFKIARRFVRSYIQRPIFWPNFSHCRPTMSGRVVRPLTVKLQTSNSIPTALLHDWQHGLAVVEPWTPTARLNARAISGPQLW